MTSIVLLRGLPGSGKSTIARDWVALEPSLRARTNRDDLRRDVFHAEGVLPYAQEQIITQMQQESVRLMLKAGISVVVDDTNLRLKFARAWADLAHECGVAFIVHDVKTDVDTCVLRDEVRRQNGGRHVSEDVIRGLAARFPIARWPEIERSQAPATHRWEPYVHPLPHGSALGLPAFIVDIDGTVAKKRMGEGERGWYEYDRVSEDLPNEPVIEMVRLLSQRYRIIFMSGRKWHCRDQTQAWLEKHVGGWAGHAELFMRADEDNRADDLVKYDLFNEHVRDRMFRIAGVLDDRDRVVAMWRALGLQVYQVAPGAF